MAFGIIAIIIMLCTMDMDYTDIWRYLKQAGIYFPLILGLWLDQKCEKMCIIT